MKNESLRCQEGIVKWFLVDPCSAKTEQSVRTVCKQLVSAGTAEAARLSEKYHIIYPLLKLGVVEFYGKEYSLSPSVALQKGNIMLLCNVPFQGEAPPDDQCLFDSGLGIQVYKINKQLISFLKAMNVPVRKFDVSSLLSGTSLDKIVAKFPAAKVLDSTGFYYLNESNKYQQGWEMREGIYKANKELYTPRLLMRGENDWCRLANNWIDLPMAVLWCKIKHKHVLDIQYDPSKRTLFLNREYFPLVLERLLVINTLLEGQRYNYMSRSYQVNKHQFNTINSIFHHRITVI